MEPLQVPQERTRTKTETFTDFVEYPEHVTFSRMTDPWNYRNLITLVLATGSHQQEVWFVFLRPCIHMDLIHAHIAPNYFMEKPSIARYLHT